MSPEQFKQAVQNFDKIVDRIKARVSRDGRRETA